MSEQTRPGALVRKPPAIKFLLMLLLASDVFAEEGMWMPAQLPQLARPMKAQGLLLPPKQLSSLTGSPLAAIIDLGGCTASFVSAQGLVLTNHHCVFGAVQYNSTAARNLIKTGYRANACADELSAPPGTRLLVTVDVNDVTDQVLDSKTAALAGKARIDAIEANQKSVISGCERQTGYRCTVSAYYSGHQFFMTKQLMIRDVRLVYAPPEGVGKFGGETDNWMWPRHTGDYGFYRAYVGKDGKPADFNRDNVPYQPRSYLKLAQQNPRENDFVMAAGYPLRTNRARLPAEIDFTFEWNYPRLNRAGEEQLKIIAAESETRLRAELAYASTVAGINNDFKNRQGMLAAYARTHLLEHRQKEFDELQRWVQSDSKRKQKYGADIAALQKLVADRNAVAKREFLLPYVTPRLLGVARNLYRVASEKAKPDDAQRRTGFQQRDWPRIEQLLDAMDRRYDDQVDRTLTAHFLQEYLAQPEGGQNAALLAALGINPSMDAEQIKSRLDVIYGASRLSDKTERLQWMNRDLQAFHHSDDSFIKAAVALAADDLEREQRDREFNGKLQAAYSNYMDALIAWKASNSAQVYPDANGTLRITYGKIAGRSTGGADGTTWAAFTTLRGIAQKHTGSGEFDAPAAQMEAIRQNNFDRFYDPALQSVPVDFLSTLDVTGGNSGSPVLNARGELVGLLFDGTLDSVISDWFFDPSTSRAIAVDLRYLLWQLKVVEKADNLLAEMGQR